MHQRQMPGRGLEQRNHIRIEFREITCHRFLVADDPDITAAGTSVRRTVMVLPSHRQIA